MIFVLRTSIYYTYHYTGLYRISEHLVAVQAHMYQYPHTRLIHSYSILDYSLVRTIRVCYATVCTVCYIDTKSQNSTLRYYGHRVAVCGQCGRISVHIGSVLDCLYSRLQTFLRCITMQQITELNRATSLNGAGLQNRL